MAMFGNIFITNRLFTMRNNQRPHQKIHCIRLDSSDVFLSLSLSFRKTANFVLFFFPLSPIYFNEIVVDDNVLKIRQQQSNFYRWIEAFRTHSHQIAQTNPIELKKNTRYLHTFTTIGSFDCIM